MNADDIARELAVLLRDLYADRVTLDEARVRVAILAECVRVVELRARLDAK